MYHITKISNSFQTSSYGSLPAGTSKGRAIAG